MSDFFPILKPKLEKIPTNWKKVRQIGKKADKLEKSRKSEKKPQLQKETPLGAIEYQPTDDKR